ncbi:uncharacterized protein LOC110416612 [Herrania umbratica]|uniref:Uncharacterized protein LOC110416612 n=1 Tax=Herrania umbratica TaxID=108875 RepID=A0A6J1ACB6_9ROSI|nr:uncharacterized protein LOC110416612 [Herrania umbratica]XP_021284314.1 uncharacterized protein LOC110416612 [Herrania umbratica]
MLKQSACRNQRYKGFKVKHVLQICALLALCIWLLNQVRDTYDKKGTGIFRKVTSEHVAINLGRKDLDPQVQGSSTDQNSGSGEVEAEEEVEESNDGRGGGDDEIDGRDQEKGDEEETEEVEDLIDEEDREKENQIEDLNLLEDQAINEGEENLQDPREETYKSDDASSSIVQSNLDTGTAAQIRRLRSVEETLHDEQNGEEVSSFSVAQTREHDGNLSIINNK